MARIYSTYHNWHSYQGYEYEPEFDPFFEDYDMKKLPPKPFEVHQHHQTEIRPSTNTRHYAQYYCVDCQKFIGWVSKRHLEQMAQNLTI